MVQNLVPVLKQADEFVFKRMFMIVSGNTCSPWYPGIIQSVLLQPFSLLLAANQKSLLVNTHQYWPGPPCYLSITEHSSFSLVALAWERWINRCSKKLYCWSVFNLCYNLVITGWGGTRSFIAGASNSFLHHLQHPEPFIAENMCRLKAPLTTNKVLIVMM